jgi:hypothetical protein
MPKCRRGNSVTIGWLPLAPSVRNAGKKVRPQPRHTDEYEVDRYGAATATDQLFSGLGGTTPKIWTYSSRSVGPPGSPQGIPAGQPERISYHLPVLAIRA